MTTSFSKISDKFIYWLELSQPHLSNVDFSQTPVDNIIPIFIKQGNEKAVPVAPYIFHFYAYNQLISEMCRKHHDIVPKEYLELHLGYQDLLNNISEKLFTYITVSSLTEAGYSLNLNPLFEYVQTQLGIDDLFDSDIEYSTYIKIFSKAEGKKVIENIINSLFSETLRKTVEPKDLFNFVKEIGFNYCNIYSQTNAETSEEFLSGYNLLPFKNMKLDSLFNILEEIFEKGKFEDTYGGSKWKDIIHHVAQFARGEINSEIFVDQSFSLEHNNGSLFSKNVIFETSEKFNILIQNEFDDNIPFHQKFINFNQLLLNSQNHSNIFQILQMDIQGLLDKTKAVNNDSYENIEQFLIFQQFIRNNCHTFLEKFNHLITPSEELNFDDILNHDPILCKFIAGDINKLNTTKKNKFTFNIYDSNSILQRRISKEIVGNKAWGIAQLGRLGIPTPKALVLDIPTCISYTQSPKKFDKALQKNIKSFYKVMGYTENPKMVSVRSGGSISMPGMMDTILNVGIDDKTYPHLCRKYSQEVIDQCAIKFMHQFSKNIGGGNFSENQSLAENLSTFKNVLTKAGIPISGTQFPLCRDDQIKYCIEHVFSSWNSARALAWRNENKISNNSGTACTIQEMVLGNFNNNSMTGVVFSRDCILGQDKMIGEYLSNAQGEDIVSGTHTPQSIDDLKITHPNIYFQLKTIAKTLEEEYQNIQDIEFTVENGKLYILQHRKAVASPIAHAQLLNNHYKLLSDLDMSVLKNSLDVQTNEEADITGKCAQDGILHGIIIESEEDKIKYQSIYQSNLHNGNFGWILSTKNSSPEHTPLLLKSDAFITQQGGNTCHAAIIARSLKKPCIVGTGQHNLKPGDIVTMNAYSGEIWNGIIPISYDSTQAHSISRNIIKLSNFTEDNISFNKEHMTELLSWNAQFSNSQILKTYQPENKLSDIQKAAIMIIQNKRSIKSI